MSTTQNSINETLVVGALGTPASGTLTNCIGLPFAGITNVAYNSGNNNLNFGSSTTQAGGGSGNVFFGVPAAGNPSGGIAGCSQNTGFGSSALIGLTSGSNNTAIGKQTGNIITTGTENTLIGATATVNSISATNRTSIGYGAICTVDNAMQLGNTSVTTINTSATINANLMGNVLGNVTGNVTGNTSGSSGSCTGNSATATSAAALTTARLINGVSFNGTANIISGLFMDITGCIPSGMTGTKTTAHINTGPGNCADSTNSVYLTSVGYGWDASTGNAINGTDAPSSTLANSTTYHMFLCNGGSGTGVFASASLTPTFPTGYTTYNRRIFSFNTGATGSPLPYTAIEESGGGLICYLTTQVLDISAVAVGTTQVVKTLASVPSGIKIEWLYRIQSTDSVTASLIITSGDETNVAPPAPAGFTVPLFDLYAVTTIATSGIGIKGDGLITTNTSGQIGLRSSSATSSTVYGTTRGFRDFRRS